MISFGCDYCWTIHSSHFDHKKHMQRCQVCYSGKTCYFALQERGLNVDRYTFLMYLCYLTYAPLYIAGPIVGYNAFAAQLEVPQKNYSFTQISWYGLRWILSFLLMEGMTHCFHYNSFVVSRLWQKLSPFEVFIISYGVRLYCTFSQKGLHCMIQIIFPVNVLRASKLPLAKLYPLLVRLQQLIFFHCAL